MWLGKSTNLPLVVRVRANSECLLSLTFVASG
jgi:hypothetical protein